MNQTKWVSFEGYICWECKGKGKDKVKGKGGTFNGTIKLSVKHLKFGRGNRVEICVMCLRPAKVKFKLTHVSL